VKKFTVITSMILNCIGFYFLLSMGFDYFTNHKIEELNTKIDSLSVSLGGCKIMSEEKEKQMSECRDIAYGLLKDKANTLSKDGNIYSCYSMGTVWNVITPVAISDPIKKIKKNKRSKK
jgi:hypothetical protein